MYFCSLEANVIRESTEMDWSRQYGKLMLICSKIVVLGFWYFKKIYESKYLRVKWFALLLAAFKITASS